MPGLGVKFSGNGLWCTWGVNMHTSSYNYLTTAGHCMPSSLYNTTGWTWVEALQNNSFLLTAGGQFLKSLFVPTGNGRYDMARLLSPQADTNCYQSWNHCASYIRYRALHNSWEINSDTVCASVAGHNDYRCGVVLEENYDDSSSFCVEGRSLRFGMVTTGGDSGGGLIDGTVAQTTIDGIINCNALGWSLANTAYDVKTQLGADFNCASSRVYGRAGGLWGTCPARDR